MKLKFIIFAIVVCGAIGLNFVFSKQIEFKGLEKREVKSADMLKWKQKSDLIIENQNNQIYLQESIGSEKAIIASPNDYKGDVIIKFKAMPLSAATSLFVKLYSDNKSNYSFNIKTAPQNIKPSISKNNKIIEKAEKDNLTIGNFVNIELGKRGKKLMLSVNGKKLVEAVDNEPLSAGRIEFEIQGLPNHPAAVLIKDLEIYEE